MTQETDAIPPATTLPPPRAAAIAGSPAAGRCLPALHDESIVCFAKDWDEDPTSNNHIMRLLAKDNRVLWLNSIATRRPNLTDSRDLGKMGRKLMTLFRGPRHVSDGLWVYTPIILPFPHSLFATWINA